MFKITKAINHITGVVFNCAMIGAGVLVAVMGIKDLIPRD